MSLQLLSFLLSVDPDEIGIDFLLKNVMFSITLKFYSINKNEISFVNYFQVVINDEILFFS